MYLITKSCYDCGKHFEGDGNIYNELCSKCQVKAEKAKFKKWKDKLIKNKSEKQIINILLKLAYDQKSHSHYRGLDI